jgi:hypothetical protein
MKPFTSTLTRLALLAGASLMLTGCAGYTLGPAKPAALGAVNTIYVPTFGNDTLEPRTEILVTNSVIKEFQMDGTYKMVNYDNADAVLEASIAKIERRPRRSVRGNTLATSEFELQLEIKYELIGRANGVLLRTGTVSGDTNFFVGDDLQAQERQAIPLAAEEAAQELVSRLAEGW